MSDLIPVKQIDTHLIQPHNPQKKIYTRSISGLFNTIRNTSVAFLMLGFFLLPWLNMNERQAVYFDITNRQFNIFFMTFWPQDFILLSALLIICAFGLFFITVFAGRVWCGYTCPQTIWTLIFIWIEEKVEGRRNNRIKLDNQGFSFSKLIKKSIKHSAWLFVAFMTAFSFVGYFSPIRDLFPNMANMILNWWEISFLIICTVLTYLNAGWMREKVCIYMCPYARFQSVMFDPDTLIVSYDTKRGEPRGARKKDSYDPIDAGNLTQGDCIECELCVQVCPTGIDIRHGLQYQCIGCALCIDACDSIMDKMEYPRGLIRYTSESSLEGKPTHWLRPRIIGYFVALVAMIGLLVFFLNTREPLNIEIIKSRGSLYSMTDSDNVSNSFTLKVMNMSQDTHNYKIEVSGMENISLSNHDMLTLAPGEVVDVLLNVIVPMSSVQRPNNTITFSLEQLDGKKFRIEKEGRMTCPTQSTLH